MPEMSVAVQRSSGIMARPMAPTEDLLTRVRDAFVSRNIAHGIAWLEHHKDWLLHLKPSHPNAPQIAAYLSLWVDLGFADVAALEALLDRFSRSSRSHLPIEDYVHLLLAEGVMEATLGRSESSLGRFELILAIANETPVDSRVVAFAHFWKGRCLSLRGDFEAAAVCATKSRELAQSLGYTKLAAGYKIFESWTQVELDKLSVAVELLEQARVELGKTEDWSSQGNFCLVQGLIAVCEGRFCQAIEQYTEAASYYRKRGAPKRSLVRALEKAAEAKRQLTLRTARSIDARLKRRRSGSPRGNPKGSGHSHSVRRCEELRTEALENLAEAEALCRVGDDDHGLGSVHIARALLSLDKGELDKAMAEASEAYKLGQTRKDLVLLCRSRLIHSEVETAKYDDGIDEGYDPTLHAQRAHDYAQDALNFAKRANNRRLMAAANIRIGLSMCNEFFNDLESASGYCDDAAKYLANSRREQFGEDFRRLKSYILHAKRADVAPEAWSNVVVGDRTLRQLKDEFDQMIILQVWDREDRKISRVAKALAISPKKVRRFLERFRTPVE